MAFDRCGGARVSLPGPVSSGTAHPFVAVANPFQELQALERRSRRYASLTG